MGMVLRHYQWNFNKGNAPFWTWPIIFFGELWLINIPLGRVASGESVEHPPYFVKAHVGIFVTMKYVRIKKFMRLPSPGEGTRFGGRYYFVMIQRKSRAVNSKSGTFLQTTCP